MQKKIHKLYMVRTGNYRLAEDWKCQAVIDNTAKAVATLLLQKNQLPVANSYRPYGPVYELIIPKGVIITLNRFSKDGIYFNLYQKYNKGTDYPTIHIPIQWSKCTDQFPVLEDL